MDDLRQPAAADVYAPRAGRSRDRRPPRGPRARRRHARFFALARLPAGRARARPRLRRDRPARAEPELDITGVDLVERPTIPGPFVRADAAAGLPFADGEFDLVYCSSVIEHVPPARRAAFAAELRRVGRGWFVQTPACSFPIEPHSLLPFAHWLPVVAAQALLAARRRRRLGGDLAARGAASSKRCSARRCAERVGPLVKSWVCVRAPAR